MGEKLERLIPGFPARVFAQWDSERTVLPQFETDNSAYEKKKT
jgi:hypothetical protein